ncbi:disease resistance RGA4 isoform X1 [Olea europaea subsp. europaea]|uniref:Disease resistance RGA4 isoform X1 n=1 Tax=Olea europaea subsp. europaea TaxID=158383 RepID=A0A8S0R1V2_OLEEU|nr:disease resistance RGA4 isoform X1 [Olea europaea subsp. europaea]
MGEAVVSSTLGELSSQLISSLFGEIKLVCGVNGEFQRLDELLSSLECAILDSEMQPSRSNQERDRLKKLENLVEDSKLVVDDFQTEAKRQRVENRFTDKVTRVCSRPIFLYKMSHRIQNTRKRLNDIASNSEALNFIVPDQNPSLVHNNLSRETTSFLGEPADVFGRDDDKERIVQELIGNSSTERLSVIPIVGMGGLGKTTLAQLVYDDVRVKQVFQMRKWVYVPKKFEFHDMIERIFSSLDLSTTASLQDLKDLLQEKLTGKKLLIMLDDLWNVESLEWDQLRNLLLVGDVGSKVVVTTQDENVARMLTSMPYIDRLELLSEKATWDVFKRWAFRSGKEWDHEIIKEIEKLVVEKCRGLPLAAKALGMALSTKEVDEWLSLLKGRVWEMRQGKHYVTQVIRFSFDQLPSYMKRCFLYSAVHGFQSFSKDDLIQQWMALDMIPVSDSDQLEDKGNGIVNELSARCFFHNIRYVDSQDNTSCDMHNAVFEFARSAPGSKFSEINLTTKNIPEITRYVQLCDSSNVIPKFPRSLLKQNKLQTFVWSCGNVNSSSPIRDISPIFSSFLSLRTLDFLATQFEVLPRTIK